MVFFFRSFLLIIRFILESSVVSIFFNFLFLLLYANDARFINGDGFNLMENRS